MQKKKENSNIILPSLLALKFSLAERRGFMVLAPDSEKQDTLF